MVSIFMALSALITSLMRGWKAAIVLPSLSSMRLTKSGEVLMPWLAKAV